MTSLPDATLCTALDIGLPRGWHSTPPMAIYDEVRAFIHAPEQARFESLALHVFRHQFDTVTPYRQYCLTRQARPDDVRSLDEIPALSTAAFKYAELSDTVTGSQPADARVFMTTGTTAR